MLHLERVHDKVNKYNCQNKVIGKFKLVEKFTNSIFLFTRHNEVRLLSTRIN